MKRIRRGLLVSQKNLLTLFFSNPARGTLHKREKEGERKRRSCVATIDIIYVCSCICVYNVFGRNSTPSFSLLWSVLRAGFDKKSEYIFLRHLAPADVHLTACGPPSKKFGHPWFRAFIVNLSSKTVVYRSVLGIVTWMKDSNCFQSFPGI